MKSTRAAFFCWTLLLLFNAVRVQAQQDYTMAGAQFNSQQARQVSDRIIISDRVGMTIDSRERKYFRLFPGVTGYDSSNVISVAGGSYRFEVNRKPDYKSLAHKFELSNVELGALRDYIDCFELYCTSGGISPVLSQRADLVRLPGKRVKGSEVVVHTDSKQKYCRTLFCVTDSSLVLLRSGTSYKWKSKDSDLWVIPRSEIQRVHVQSSRPYWQRAATAFVMGFVFGFSVDHIPGAVVKKRKSGSRFWRAAYYGGGMAAIAGVVNLRQRIRNTHHINGFSEKTESEWAALRESSQCRNVAPPELESINNTTIMRK